MSEQPESERWDHSSDERFTSYYEQDSATEEAYQRCVSSRDALLSLLREIGHPTEGLEVLDIGCNAGTLSNAWAELGHTVHGLDINAPLLEAARKRSAEAGFDIDYRLGSATELPWPDQSMDVAVALELLEHVEDWEKAVTEMMRVVKPGGLIYLSTTNLLCPMQSEFNLPGYSWYPGFLKRRYLELATSSRPELVNYARYPAYHWFTYYGLREFGRRHGFESYDRFDVAACGDKSGARQFALSLIRALPPLRFFAHVATEGTAWAAIRRP